MTVGNKKNKIRSGWGRKIILVCFEGEPGPATNATGPKLKTRSSLCCQSEMLCFRVWYWCNDFILNSPL